jgi:hypothetical protein
MNHWPRTTGLYVKPLEMPNWEWSWRIIFVICICGFIGSPHKIDPPEQLATNSADYGMQKRPKLRSVKDFCMQSNPHSDQKHTNTNFTDRLPMIFCFINESDRCPKVSEMFEVTDKGHKIFGTAPLDREASDRVWQQNERYAIFEELPGERLLPGSPLEHL